MAKRLTAVFRAADLAKTLHPRRFGNDVYHYEFPFVRDTEGGRTRAIRPLHLAQADTTKIIARSVWRKGMETSPDLDVK